MIPSEAAAGLRLGNARRSSNAVSHAPRGSRTLGRYARKLHSMQSYEAVTSDPAELVYRHHEQLYRLALLLAGDTDGAAKLVERAYRQLPPAASNAPMRQ